MKDETSIGTFEDIDMRIGEITDASGFPEARDPAYQIEVHFGEEIGTLQTSAKVTDRYEPEDLIGRKVVGLVNLPDLQVASFTSEFLLMGAVEDEGVSLLSVDNDPDPGTPVR